MRTISDAMWRIYSPEKNGIRVRTTIGKLANSLSESTDSKGVPRSFIGKVRYLSKAKLYEFGGSLYDNGLDAPNLASTLLVKRVAFRHEREIRLIYFANGAPKTPDSLFRYGIDPLGLVDQLMIDPRLGASEAPLIAKEIRETTGFPGDIKRSLLYAPPKDFIFRIP